MKTFKIDFLEHEREHVARVLKESNDIIIDTWTDHNVFITIERDDADNFYEQIRSRIYMEGSPYHHTNIF